MPRSREISEDLRKKVVEAHQSGKGYKLISKALGLSKTTVRAILRKWKMFGTVMNLPRSGRPPKLSAKTRREIMRAMMKNPSTTSKDMQAALSAVNISVHDSTIRRILGVHGRPTLTRLKDIMSLRISDDECSDELLKDVKVENEDGDLDQHDSMNDGCGGAVNEEGCKETLRLDSGDRYDCGNDGADVASEKNLGSNNADSDCSDGMMNKYNNDEEEEDGYDEDGISYENGCEGGGGNGIGNDGLSCDEETEGDSTPQ